MTKILVLSCKGGGGHMSAAIAIEAHLNNYNVKIIDVLGDTLNEIDPIYRFSGHRLTAQDFYNVLLQNNLKRITNCLYQIGWFLFWIKRKSVYRLLEAMLKKEKPSLIISVTPMINDALADLAATMEIPFLLVPTDLDLRSFTAKIKTNKWSWLGLGFNDPVIRALIQPGTFAQEQIFPLGFPVRPSFLHPLSKQHARQLLGLDDHLPVIMIIMGAAGSRSLISYVQALADIPTPFQLLVCVGRSIDMMERLKECSLPPHISLTLLDTTADIAQVMAAADLCISKPGSVTFAETIYSKLPTFLDATMTALVWEAYNLKYIENKQCGMVIRSYKQTREAVVRFLTDNNYQQSLVRTLEKIERLPFDVNIQYLVRELLKQKSFSEISTSSYTKKRN